MIRSELVIKYLMYTHTHTHTEYIVPKLCICSQKLYRIFGIIFIMQYNNVPHMFIVVLE